MRQHHEINDLAENLAARTTKRPMVRTRTPKPDKLPSWRIVAIRKKGERVAVIAAKDAQAAIEKAAELYGLDPKRLMALRMEE